MSTNPAIDATAPASAFQSAPTSTPAPDETTAPAGGGTATPADVTPKVTGVNRNIAPSGANEMLGRGKVFFDRFTPGTTTRTGELDLGNCTIFELEPSTEQKEKYESMDAKSLLYSMAITRVGMKVKITGDEYAIDTMAIPLLGDTIDIAQTTGTATSQPIGPAAGITLNRWYWTGQKSITVTGVQQGATTLVAGTDYIVDSLTGRIFFPSTGAATAAATTWTGTWVATSFPNIRPATATPVEGFLRFVGNPVKGPTFEVKLWHVSFKPSGAMAFISEDFSSFQLEGDVLAEFGAAGDANSPFGYITQLK